MSISRRAALKAIGAVPAAAGLTWPASDVALAQEAATRARRAARAAKTVYTPKFFTQHEWQTVRLLVDVIIPRDDRSGSATEAGVPEFMDFMMVDRPQWQHGMRGGLRWLDIECRRRFDQAFTGCTPEQQRLQVLDDISGPNDPRPGFSQGAAFFANFRDMTATGFWTSKMGIEDLQYTGNQPVAEWNGCPDAAMKHLGVTHTD
jgi:gluconate 2-dehydrogenase gamma chain